MKDITPDQKFGEYIKGLRLSRGMTINQLSMYSKVSSALISRIERGDRGIPKPETIKKLSRTLGVPYDEMMRVAGYINSQEKADVRKARELEYVLRNNPSYKGRELTEEEAEAVLKVLEAIVGPKMKMDN